MSWGSVCLLLKAKREFISTAIIGVILFGTGWQLGRVMSPYYASSPIIFQDMSCAAPGSSPGDPEALKVLRSAGIEAKSTPASVVVKAAPPNASLNNEAKGLFAGSKNSNKYHDVRCTTWRSIKAENRVWFQTKAEAESKGYLPTACTKEKLGL